MTLWMNTTINSSALSELHLNQAPFKS